MAKKSQKKITLDQIIECFSKAGVIYSKLIRSKSLSTNIDTLNEKMSQILSEYSSVLHSKVDPEIALVNAKVLLKEIEGYLTKITSNDMIPSPA
ncbi:hypothetical protein HOG21_04645 [bacterium]|jgi:hypothetical protein|nr:hypothetical protein [bacterium]